ncbi:hypothetical protein C1645_744482 [Glomus cerebriforme]|uniref:Uncharacterized protein n=1 Tax=Glomus cerebriforme TaxID=658196 RepID=A0A397SFE6_9GLOM|nr:hypothetical protein C1645_744482 [Glomus cerebriforme]
MDKYKLLTNDPYYHNKTVQLNINGSITDITIGPKSASERILGYYINANNMDKGTISHMKSVVSYNACLLRKKRITHDHASYIINKVILPKLEYMMNFTFLNASILNQIMKPLKQIFKHKLNLSSTTNDNIIYTDLNPYIQNLNNIQTLAHLPLYNYIFNSSNLQHIARQLITNSQLDFWLPFWPNLERIYNIDESKYPTFTTFSKALIKFASIGCTFSPSFNTTIIGGSTAIIDQLPFDAPTIRSWKTRTLIFEDQLTLLDGQYVKTWNDINIDPDNPLK